MELVYRILLYCVLAVLPTLLFLGLWRGLMYLRDDELVRRAMEKQGVRSPSPEAGRTPGSTLLTDGPVPAPEPDAAETVVCDGCGTPNLAGMRFCQNCLAKLPEE